MGRHEHALALGHAAQHARAVIVERFDLGEQAHGVGCEQVLASRIAFDQPIAHDLDGLGPRGRVHPHVRIVLALHVFGLDEVLRVDELGDGVHAAIGGSRAHERVGHAPLEQQAVVEDHVGREELLHVAAGGLVEVRIDACAHEHRDLGPISSNADHDVADHASGGNDRECVVATRAALWLLALPTPASREGQQDENQSQHDGHHATHGSTSSLAGAECSLGYIFRQHPTLSTHYWHTASGFLPRRWPGTDRAWPC